MFYFKASLVKVRGICVDLLNSAEFLIVFWCIVKNEIFITGFGELNVHEV